MSYLGPITRNLDPVINYISNGRAYDSTIGWATYADAAGAQPVDGTGGSPNVTWSRDTTTPLRQGADFNFVKDAANRQGQGVSYDFTIDNADLAKVLTVTFDYEVLSGTYATGDLTVYLIQDPSGTPTVVQPAGYQIQSATVGTKMRQIATFQTSSSVTSYRLCLHVASVSASAYSLAVDNVVVGPQVVQYGAPVTDWQSYTPVITNLGTGTTSSSFGKWRRVGDSIEIEFRWQKDGSAGTGAGNVTMSLPSGLTVDSSKLPNSVSAPSGQLYVSGAATVFMPAVDPTGITFLNQTSAAQVTGSQVAANSAWVGSVNNVPILGWSSSVQMSNDTDTRVVDLAINPTSAITPSGTISTTFAGSSTVNFNTTPTKDSHGIYSAGVITIPVAGDYACSVKFETQGTGGTFWEICYSINGVQVAESPSKPTTNNQYIQGSVLLPNLKAGDLLTIRLRTDCTSPLFVASIVNGLSLFRLSGPSAIAASETVAAAYWASANGTATTATPYNFDSREVDTHGSVTTGAAWRFTAPIAGLYLVGLHSNTTVSVAAYSMLYKNGTAYKVIGYGGTAETQKGYGEIRLNAGEYIEIRPTTTVQYKGGALNDATGSANIFITRVGN